MRQIRPGDPEWPRVLGELGPHVPPTRLYAEGLPLDTAQRGVAIVGTRNPTLAGVEAAGSISKGLVEGGFVVVSGFARGIDAAAHRAALDAGGTTVAVLGCGLDVDYPRRNSKLKERVRAGGTLLTEYPPGSEPAAWHFPLRNRIVVGLCSAVVVVEGGLQSGALITARIGIDANRSVYAVPGSLRNPMAAGPNELIKKGLATLVTTYRDICDDLAPALLFGPGEESGRTASDVELRVLEILDDTPAQGDTLGRALDMPAGELAITLSKLEVRGWASKSRAGYSISSSGARVRLSQGEAT